MIGGKKTSIDQNEDVYFNENRFTLPQIGIAVEKLMGNAYRCHYTTRVFKNCYEKYKGKTTLKRTPNIGNLNLRSATKSIERLSVIYFKLTFF